MKVELVIWSPALKRELIDIRNFVQEGLQRNAVYKIGKAYDLYLYGKLKPIGAYSGKGERK